MASWVWVECRVAVDAVQARHAKYRLTTDGETLSPYQRPCLSCWLSRTSDIMTRGANCQLSPAFNKLVDMRLGSKSKAARLVLSSARLYSSLPTRSSPYFCKASP